MKAPAQATNSPAGGWSAMLRARMIHNAAVRSQPAAQHGELRIEVPTRRPGWLVPPLSWVVRPPAFRTLTLDALGVEVWTLCDGQRTVEAVIDSFAEKNRLTFHEARVSVTAYLKSLLQQGALAVAADKNP
ncbi:MAG TPA: PqqD family protein [Kiritimatiellia bacterium]|nr:PqqD family protein [Kiritimatiellia bacterium]HRZ12611.1 PqqD family protein [Kiritimatiellia bacterium]HSA17689.1 PqqD family protein [Kiritimatiellia bacterium]